jgi:hypothetical protein
LRHDDALVAWLDSRDDGRANNNSRAYERVRGEDDPPSSGTIDKALDALNQDLYSGLRVVLR